MSPLNFINYTAEPMVSLTRKELLQLAVLLVLAFAVRSYHLGDASLWIDEVATIKWADIPILDWSARSREPTPPLYYSFMQLVLYLGHSEFMLRLPSVLFGTATIAIIFLAARQIGGSPAAFSASLILALSFHNIEYSQEARAYALLGFCISLSFLGLIKLHERWKDSPDGFTFKEFFKSGAGMYAAGLIAALYTHNTAVFFWLGVQFFFIGWWIRPFKFSAPCLAGWAAVNLAVLLLWMPWLLASLQLIESGSFGWLGHKTPERAFAIWRSVHGLRTGVSFSQPYADLALLALALLGLYSLRRRYALIGLFVGLLVSSSLFIWAFGLISSPVYMIRTILWGSLFSAVVIGIGVSSLPRYARMGVIVLIFMGGSAAALSYHRANAGENQDWRSAVSIVKELQRPQDILLFVPHYVSQPFFYYLEDYSPNWSLVGWSCGTEAVSKGKVDTSGSVLRVNWTPNPERPAKPIPPNEGATLWIIQSHCRQPWAGHARQLSNWTAREVNKFKGVTLYQLTPLKPSSPD
jgi:uncharacterized membrane protein